MPRTRTNGSVTQEHEAPSTSSRRGTKRPYSSTPNWYPVNYFWNKKGQTSYYKPQGARKTQCGIYRQILPGRAITTDFLRAQRFDEFADLLNFQGWSAFVGQWWEYEPSLIRQFYHNLKLEESDSGEPNSYESKVFGKVVHISAKALALHFFGSDDLDAGACPTFNLATAVRSLQEPDCVDHDSRKVSDMTLQNRFLFHILTRIIRPRGGSHSAATSSDVELLYFINNRVKVCLPNVMLEHIIRVAGHKSSACVYGMALTNFLIGYCQVPRHPEDSIALPKSKIYYTEGHLGWLYDKDTVTGEWKRKFHSKANSAPVLPRPTDPDHEAEHVASSTSQLHKAPQQAPHVPALPTYLDSAANHVVWAIEGNGREVISQLTQEIQVILVMMHRIDKEQANFNKNMAETAHHLSTRLSVLQQCILDVQNTINNANRPGPAPRRRPTR